jgi:hypothetical protein
MALKRRQLRYVPAQQGFHGLAQRFREPAASRA